jgi:hypothetical protein
MAGSKLFVNNTGKDLQVTLFIRASDNPANSAGTQAFRLGSSQQNWITYGTDQNIYLNGISLVGYFNGQVTGTQDFVINRGSSLDNELNMNNRVEFRYGGDSFQISTNNT